MKRCGAISTIVFILPYVFMYPRYCRSPMRWKIWYRKFFISVWEGKRTFSDIKELTNYLYRACYNNALLYIRNNQIHDTILSSLAEEESMVDEDTIYALTVKEEIIRQLYCYIEELPAEQRRIILMRIEGHTWEEIAERLEISINTVKTQKTRSYKFLRERLGDSIHSIILFFFSKNKKTF